MPRKSRTASSTGAYHYISRGVARHEIFHEHKDYLKYFKLLTEYSASLNVAIYHFCLMTNHIHLILSAVNIQTISQFSYYVQRRYAQYYSLKYKWEDQVFKKRFRALSIHDDSYLLECGRYIERNPVEAGIVSAPSEYVYSSYSHYITSQSFLFVTFSPAYLGMATTPEERRKVYKFYVEQKRVPIQKTNLP